MAGVAGAQRRMGGQEICKEARGLILQGLESHGQDLASSLYEMRAVKGL